MTAQDRIAIRLAVASDARALAHLHVGVWEYAYAELMPSSVFEERRRNLSERGDRWRELLEEGLSLTTVAEIDGRLIGFATVGPPRDSDVSVSEELRALYVEASWWNRRVGHELLSTAVSDRPAYLWVLRGNERAISFYRNHGFSDDGARRTDEYGTELRMIRSA